MTLDRRQAIQIIPDLWRAFPHTFAQAASRGAWQPYPWLKYVSSQIAPALIKGGGRFLVTAPPQHGKSEFLSNWVPSWYLNLFPRRRVILGTYAQEYANRWGTKVRENLLENPVSAIPMRHDTQSKKYFMTAAGGQMIAAGVGGPITGQGADLFVIDDPYKNWQEALSKQIRESRMDWLRTVARTRLTANGSIIVMHTRWHDEDMIGQLSKEAGWTVINLPAICENPETDPLGRALGQALCPERYDEAALAGIRRDVTDLFWFPLYQQNPTNAKGAIIQESWIKPWDVLPQMEEIALFADLTYEKDEENDFSVFEAWGRAAADIYLIAQIRAQMGLPEQIEAFTRIIELYPEAFHKEIEKKANGAAVIQLFEDKVPGLVANNPQTSKGARLAVVAPLYQSGNVYYPNPVSHPWVKQNIYEITRMTLAGSKANYDDTVDTASMAVKHLGQVHNALKRLEALTKQ